MSSLLITNGRLVTLDEDDRFIENGSVYIEGSRIVDVGDFAVGTYSADRTIDAGGRTGQRHQRGRLAHARSRVPGAAHVAARTGRGRRPTDHPG